MRLDNRTAIMHRALTFLRFLLYPVIIVVFYKTGEVQIYLYTYLSALLLALLVWTKPFARKSD